MVMISGPFGLTSEPISVITNASLSMPPAPPVAATVATSFSPYITTASNFPDTSSPTSLDGQQQPPHQQSEIVYATAGSVCSPTSPTMPSLSPVGFCNPLIITPGSWKQHYGMEQVWVKEFNQLFVTYLPHLWYIQPVQSKPIGGSSLSSFVDSAKVRFCCDVCGHGWTSMKGRVAFWFDLFFMYGIVAFKLYGQQCDRCKADRYEQPMWYPEEVTKVLINVYNRIGQTYYGFYCPPIEKTRRAGKPRTPHNADLCQACQDGLCADRK